jgi:hypothetical protein
LSRSCAGSSLPFSTTAIRAVYFTRKLQKIVPACEIEPDRRRAGEGLVRGSKFSHTLQEFFANPRRHLCQSSQLFHVEQFRGVEQRRQSRELAPNRVANQNCSTWNNLK